MTASPITALVVSPDGTGTLTQMPASGGAMLRVVQDTVGGYIEALPIPLDTGVSAYGNEDAKRMGLAPNAAADMILTLMGWVRYPGDHLSGTIVFLGTEDSGTEDGWVHIDAPQVLLDAATTAGVPIA